MQKKKKMEIKSYFNCQNIRKQTFNLYVCVCVTITQDDHTKKHINYVFDYRADRFSNTKGNHYTTRAKIFMICYIKIKINKNISKKY